MKTRLFQLVLATMIMVAGASVFTSCSKDDDKAPVPPTDNLAEKIIGKWIDAEFDGQPALTSEKSVVTFVSPTKAIYSISKTDFTESQSKWSVRREYDVKISGNTVTLTGHPEGNSSITLQEEYVISSITDTEMVCKYSHTTFRDGQAQGTVTVKNARLKKTDIDYRQDVIGTWEGRTSEGLNIRWDIKADGTYVYSRKVDGGEWETMVDYFNEYFADGYLFCARWKNVGDGMGEQRQWWEIESIQNGVMKWKSLGQNDDGSTSIVTAEMTKKEIDLNVAEKIIGKWITEEFDGHPAPTNFKTIYTFVSTTKADVSTSFTMLPETGTYWNDKLETDVVINGNKITLTNRPNGHVTVVEELIVNDIDGSKFTANHKVKYTVDGNLIISNEDNVCFTKVATDYRETVLGLWECTGLTGGETFNDANARLEFLADGTYRYYRMDDNNDWQAVTTREFQDYFVDGTLLATRWKNQGEDELREWWEIESLSGNEMVWTALRQNPDGSTFKQKMTWKRVE